MALIAHAGYGFRIKISEIRNPAIFDLLPKTDLENWLDGDGIDDDGNISEDVFMYMRPWDYVELIDGAAKNGFPGIFASLPGYAEADHEEICITLESTYFSAYGESKMLDSTVLADADKYLIKEFSKRYFNDAPLGWLIWPYYG